ncbi:MAG: YfhO family protein [Bacillota bacterium]|nr:YfhO family protein [Bacillota bacterium]
MKKKDYLYMLSLSIITISLVFVLKGHHLFGNSIDWYNQHVTLSDALRQAIRNEGTLFPTYLKSLMSGVNIFYFSYYGYLRPDVLLGALLMNIKMIDIISVYSIFLMILTTISCYLFLKNHLKERSLCFFISLLVLCSSLFFQSHKQIMFVNVLPFLFLMLKSVDNYFKDEKITGMILWGSLLIVHSYFYSVGCFIVYFIYFLKCYFPYRNNKKHLINLFKVYLSIFLLTAIITIPTLFVIIGGHKSVQATNYLSLLVPTFNLRGLLYNNYGCGMTYLVWMLLVLGIFKEKTRNLSLLLIVVMLIPLACFILNGFLYARSKILIVFIPLICLQIGYVLEDYSLKKFKYCLILWMIPLFFIQRPFLVLLDLIVSFIILYRNQTHKKSYFLYLLVPCLVVYFINPPNSFLSKEKYKKYNNQEVNTLIQRNEITRLALFENTSQTMNQTFENKVTRVSGYTSTNHALYNSFLYDTLKLPISLNNRVAQLDQNNPFYLKVMAIDSVISTKDIKGYQKVDQEKKYKLYQSQEVMPVVYATSQLYSQKQFQKLSYPYTLDTLYNNAIVEKGNSTYQSQFKVLDLGFDDSYIIHQKKKTNKTYKLLSSLKNKMLVLEFDIENKKPKHAVSITINGIKNKLSKITSPYYNQNTHFTYLISNIKNNELVISLSKGNYKIKNIKTYSLDDSIIENREKEVNALSLEKGRDIINGTINVSNSGYLITHLPYDQGYQIQIDGKKVKSEIVNTAFLGCQINQGKHRVSIQFQPKGYHIGFILSYLGMMLIVLNFIYERKRKNEE